MLQVLSNKESYELLAEKYRREAFASLIAGGTPPVKAMRQAGWKSPEEATREKAMVLLQDEDIKLMIRGHLDRLAETCLASKEMLIQELDFAREFAMDCENPAAVVAATLGKAKLLGYMEPDKAGKVPAKIEITWNDGSETHTEKVSKSSPLYDGIKDSVS